MDSILTVYLIQRVLTLKESTALHIFSYFYFITIPSEEINRLQMQPISLFGGFLIRIQFFLNQILLYSRTLYVCGFIIRI